MSSLQDKICNGLTLAFLLGVIGFAAVALWPEPEAPQAVPATESNELPEAPPLLETIEEVPLIEDAPEPEAAPLDTLEEEDTLSHQSAPHAVDNADSTAVHHPAPNPATTHPAEEPQHANPASETPKKEKKAHTAPTSPDKKGETPTQPE